MIRLAIDFDGTMVEKHVSPMRLRAGAVEALRAFKAAGHHLTLFSARSTPDGAAPSLDDEAVRFWQFGEVPERTRFQWDLFDEMRSFLRQTGIWDLFDDVWQSPGKPLADYFVDDLFVDPNWGILRTQLG